MIVYLVIHGSKRTTQPESISFNSEEKVIACATQIASRGFWEDVTGEYLVRNSILISIIKLDTSNLKAVRCQLALEDGRFNIKEKPTDGNQ